MLGMTITGQQRIKIDFMDQHGTIPMIQGNFPELLYSDWHTASIPLNNL